MLRLSAPVGYGTKVLSPIIADRLLIHPDMTIEAGISDRRVDLLEERFDLAVPAPPKSGDLENTGPVASEPAETGRAGIIEIDLPNGVRLRVDAQVSESALPRMLQAMKDAV